MIGAPSLALEHYRALNLKQVQTDTLSYLVLSRAATFSLSAIGDLTYSTECMEASQIYLSNSTDVSPYLYLFSQIASDLMTDCGVRRARIHGREIFSGMFNSLC